MSLIDTYQLATIGQNLTNTFTLGSNGILVSVFIEDLPDIPDYGSGIIGGTDEEKKKSQKRVTVIATVRGKDYKKSIIVIDEPTLSIEDIGIDVNDDSETPKITITVLK